MKQAVTPNVVAARLIFAQETTIFSLGGCLVEYICTHGCLFQLLQKIFHGWPILLTCHLHVYNQEMTINFASGPGRGCLCSDIDDGK